MIMLLRIADLLLEILTWIIIVQAVMSWLVAFGIVNTYNPTVRGLLRGLEQMLEPLYRPIRRILPDFGGLDFSPMVVILIIYIIRQYLIPELGYAVVSAGL